MTRNQFIASLAAIPFVGKLFKEKSLPFIDTGIKTTSLNVAPSGELFDRARKSLADRAYVDNPFETPFIYQDSIEINGVIHRFYTDRTGTYMCKFIDSKFEPWQQIAGPSDPPIEASAPLSTKYP